MDKLTAAYLEVVKATKKLEVLTQHSKCDDRCEALLHGLTND